MAAHSTTSFFRRRTGRQLGRGIGQSRRDLEPAAIEFLYS
jgi:hypothetical protein